MGFLGLFGKRDRDRVREEGARLGKVLVEFRRANPDKPLREAVKPVAESLWGMMKKDAQRQGLDFLLSEKYVPESLEEYCCALVALATDTPMSAAERYQRLETVVREELAKLG